MINSAQGGNGAQYANAIEGDGLVLNDAQSPYGSVIFEEGLQEPLFSPADLIGGGGIVAGGAKGAGRGFFGRLGARIGGWFGRRAATELVEVGEFKLTNSVAKHLDDVVGRGVSKGLPARPFLNSPLTVREIMSARPGIPDPGGFSGALRWDVPGYFRSSGTWQLVVDPKTNTILHFNFVSP